MTKVTCTVCWILICVVLGLIYSNKPQEMHLMSIGPSLILQCYNIDSMNDVTVLSSVAHVSFLCQFVWERQSVSCML